MNSPFQCSRGGRNLYATAAGAGLSGIAGLERSDFGDGIGGVEHGAQEGVDKIGVKLGFGAALEFVESLLGGAAFFVAAVAGDGVVGIGNGDDAGAERNIFRGAGFGLAGG